MARGVRQAIVNGSRDPYEGYRGLYGIYAGGAVEELKPLFRLPGVEPDGFIRVDSEFRRIVIAAAGDWLRENPPETTA
jgi:hypothetical protein